MANTAVLEPVEISSFLPSRPLKDAGLESLGRAANEALRTGCAATIGQIIARSVPDAFVGGLAQRNGVAVSLFADVLVVPTLSTAHTDLRVRFRVTVSGVGNAAVNLTTVTGGDALALVSGVAGPVDLEGLISMDTAGDYDTVTCTLSTDAGATITVHGFWIWYEPIATPIPGGTNFSEAQALGIASLGADNTYDAMKTDAMVGICENIRDRSRIIWSWIAISSAVGGDGLMLDREHRAWTTLHRGALAAGVTYRIRVSVTGAPGDVFLLVGKRRDWPNADIPIPAAGNGWLDTTFEIPSTRNNIPELPFSSASIGLHPWDGAADDPGRTTVDILSLTVWGP